MNKYYLYIIFFLITLSVLHGQEPAQDTLITDTSLFIVSATDTTDSLQVHSLQISSDSLEDDITYSAVDTILLDLKEKKIFLYNDAWIEYQEMRIEADYIEIDLKRDLALATGYLDSTGRISGKPVFKQGEREFSAEEMKYNFRTKKGRINNVTTIESDIRILGSTTKFIGPGGDSLYPEESILYNRNALFTTCDLEVPHYGIRSTKQKVITDKLAVIGPSNLEIMGVPTPLWLPFGFFPLKKGRSTGLLFPSDYTYSDRLGFGLEGIGWYFPINDYMDLQVAGDIYIRGTWGMEAVYRYNKRYKYQGEVMLGYSDQRVESPFDASIEHERSYTIRLNLNQHQAAHPNYTLGGNINIQSNNYASRNYNDAGSVFNNILTSNFSFKYNFIGKPYNLSVGLAHRQNIQTRDLTMTFPDITFNTRSIYPFRKEKRTGPEKWFEKINFTYSGNAFNEIKIKDSLLFSEEALDAAIYGVTHTVRPEMSFKVLRYFNVNPAIEYREAWAGKTLSIDLQDTLLIETDTVFFNPDDSTDFQVDRDTVFGLLSEELQNDFGRIYDYRAGVSINTNIYGTWLNQRGWLRGVRHQIKPVINFNYRPSGNRFFDEYDTDLRPDFSQRQVYNRFERSRTGITPRRKESLSLDLTLQNIIELKLWNKKDSAERNIQLLRNFTVTTGYDFSADSLNVKDVIARGNTSLLKNLMNLRFGFGWSYYGSDRQGRRLAIPEHSISGNPLRFLGGNIDFTTRFRWSRLSGLFASERKEFKKGSLNHMLDQLVIEHLFNLDWIVEPGGDKDLLVTLNQIQVQGSLPLTDNWTLTSRLLSYNFLTQNLVYPDIVLTRDLHCWSMSLSVQPDRNTYTFHIGVKPGSLDFIKLPYRRNRFDAQRF